MHRSRNLMVLLICVLSALAVMLGKLSISADLRSTVSTSNLGNLFYSLKTLDGLFFSVGDSLFLISGTEVHSGNTNQVFIYDVTHDNLVADKRLENSTSMTAFCQTDDFVYFAGISDGSSTGCDLYAWIPSSNEISLCAHFSEKGIYALVWDGGDQLFVGTSYQANVYGYDMVSGDVYPICISPTEENFIRSMSAGGAFVSRCGDKCGFHRS